ncbi:hypothetical protein RhiirA4_492340 [Rhizophagus irregularis]|uniref:Uncharacterized protein n=1 Tax=Rhizophagus irregularis TaxID=588596 RepID=A0A2I1HX56_9GLOM|nr:hypothetical protein RhiirA4_492340 [Rhizophagus irregularis]
MEINQGKEGMSITQDDKANQMINYNAQLAYYWQNSYFILNEEFLQKHNLIKLIELDLEEEFNELERTTEINL